MRPLARATWSVLLLLLVACAGVEVESSVSSAWEPFGARTWGWLEEPDATTAGALDGAGDAAQLAARWREAVEAGMAAAGWGRVDRRDAAYLLEFRTSVSVRSRNVDPYFAVTTGERLEVGALELHLIDPADGRSAWSAKGSATLRRVARQVGVLDKSWEPTNDARDWPVDRLVKAVLGALPTATGATADSAADEGADGGAL